MPAPGSQAPAPQRAAHGTLTAAQEREAQERAKREARDRAYRAKVAARAHHIPGVLAYVREHPGTTLDGIVQHLGVGEREARDVIYDMQYNSGKKLLREEWVRDPADIRIRTPHYYLIED